MRNSKVILTNMCMLYKEDGTFLVIDRKKQDWPGINFPGGHVEDEESVPESVIREMKEETGYDLHSVEECGYFEWNGIRWIGHLRLPRQRLHVQQTDVLRWRRP